MVLVSLHSNRTLTMTKTKSVQPTGYWKHYAVGNGALRALDPAQPQCCSFCWSYHFLTERTTIPAALHNLAIAAN